MKTNNGCDEMNKFTITVNKERINSLLLVIYIFSVTLALPFEKIIGIPSLSVVIACLTVIVSFFINKSANLKMNMLIILILVIFLMDILIFEYRQNSIKIFILLLRWGLPALYLSCKITDFKNLLIYWHKIGLLNLIIVNIFYILTSYKEVENYMTVGVYLTYSFIPFIINYYNNKNKFSLCLSIFTLIEIMVFTNRGSISCCLIIILYMELTQNRNYKNTLKAMLKLLLLYIFALNLNYIIVVFDEIISKFGISSYSFAKLLQFKDLGLAGTSSGRNVIYEISMNIVRESNLKANGIGYFDYATGLGYPHNIILDIAISFGILGLLLFGCLIIILILKYFKSDRKNDGYNRFIVCISIYCITRLLISSTFWSESYFWMLLGLILFNNNTKRVLNYE